jgi:hypothetical protein
MQSIRGILAVVLFIVALFVFSAYPPLLGLIILAILFLLGIASFVEKLKKEKNNPIPHYTSTTISSPVDHARIVESNRSKKELIRAELLRLRQNIIDSGLPDIAAEKGLLRDRMLDEFVDIRPRNRGEWLKRIPLSLREMTDHTQMPLHLDRILQIIAKIDSAVDSGSH